MVRISSDSSGSTEMTTGVELYRFMGSVNDSVGWPEIRKEED